MTPAMSSHSPLHLCLGGQHIEIITRSGSLEEALFYMQHVIEKGLSRTALINCYKAHLFDHQGKYAYARGA